ncbi:hypothetical protein J4G33_10240 [Actinotalea sp. BY-33]|uniref:EcsC family protein n=1 Tax=Actinotalea soli TaxID=2819234 RepID=A0A939LSD6_9CELL|nr:hypothetical protein [Actinotalea soli]MBO1752180.1 hypothetical protein [Actinotalea soli]
MAHHPELGPHGSGRSSRGRATEVPPVTGFPFLDAAFDKAVSIPSAVIHAHVDRIRRRNPRATPAEVVRLLEKQYLLTVTTSGGAVGAAAATPAVGTSVGIALTSSEIATFFAASAAFSLAVADVHGVAVEDTARRRALLLATVLGDQGSKTIGAETGLSTKAWARTLLVNMPTSTIKRVNTALTRRILRQQAGKQGALAFGRLAPFGIGAVIGATGARALGRTVVTGAHRAFGPPPVAFARTIEVNARTSPDAGTGSPEGDLRQIAVDAVHAPGGAHAPGGQQIGAGPHPDDDPQWISPR